jgi:hypothetical protein
VILAGADDTECGKSCSSTACGRARRSRRSTRNRSDARAGDPVHVGAGRLFASARRGSRVSDRSGGRQRDRRAADDLVRYPAASLPVRDRDPVVDDRRPGRVDRDPGRRVEGGQGAAAEIREPLAGAGPHTRDDVGTAAGSAKEPRGPRTGPTADRQGGAEALAGLGEAGPIPRAERGAGPEDPGASKAPPADQGSGSSSLDAARPGRAQADVAPGSPASAGEHEGFAGRHHESLERTIRC